MKNRLRTTTIISTMLLTLVWAQGRAQSPSTPSDQKQRLALMASKGTDASLTILPARVGGRPMARVSEVIGLLLEKQGLANIEIGKTNFISGNAGTVENLAEAVGAFVQTNSITTDYALYAEFNGSPKTGLNDMRVVVVDSAGAVVWTERLTSKDQAVKNLGSPDPMSLSMLLVERLSPRFGLNEETARAAKPGKMAAIMGDRSGLPPQEELDALADRQNLMKQSLPKASLLIYPSRVPANQMSVPSATNLVRLINQARLCKVAQADQPATILPTPPDPNELRILWIMARAFREYIRAHPPETDYALFADYGWDPKNADRGYVHFVVCDRQGEWVIVDMRNSHHRDYQSADITSRARCDQLVLTRLQFYLK